VVVCLQHVVEREPMRLLVGAVGDDLPPLGRDDPNQTHPVREVEGDLGPDFSRSLRRGDDLDEEVGDDVEVAGALGRWRAAGLRALTAL
jgi:hypothetical protein